MNRKTTLILVSVFILLGLYTLWFQSSKNGAASATATPAPSMAVWKVTTDQITGFQITDQATSQTVAVSKDTQGNWSVIKPEAKPADPTQVTTLVSDLANLTLMEEITATADLGPFGLLKPAYALVMTQSDGTQLKAVIGDKILTSTGYYVLREGETHPLAVASYSLQPFIDLLAQPPYFVPTPTPQPSPGASASPTASAP